MGERKIVETLMQITSDAEKQSRLMEVYRFLNNDEIVSVISSMNYDTNKFKVLQLLNNDINSLIEVVKSYKNDKFKRDFIEKMELTEKDILDIVQTYRVDSNKMKFIESCEKRGEPKSKILKVIDSLEFDSNKMKFLSEEPRKSEYKLYFSQIAGSLKHDKSRLALINNYKELKLNHTDIFLLVDDMNFDSNKIKFLTKTAKEKYQLDRAEVIKIISGFKKDENKLKFLEPESIKENGMKSPNVRLVLSKLSTDKAKLAAINSGKYPITETDRVKLMASFESDNVKLAYLRKLNASIYATDVNSTSFKISSNVKLLTSLKNSESIFNALKTGAKIPNSCAELDKYREILALSLCPEKEDMTEDKKDALYKMCEISKSKMKVPSLPEGMTIGVELESVGANAQGNINAGILKKVRNLVGGFTAKRDTSLRGYDRAEGVEVISPVLRDGDLDCLPVITELMKKNGLTTNDTCGGHIHVGADYLDSVEAWKNFFELYNGCEDVFYKISNRAGSRPRKGVGEYAKPLSDKIDFSKGVEILNEEHLDEFIQKFKETEMGNDLKPDRRFGLNLTNINNPQKNTIEFRLYNGTLDYTTLFENIKLCTRLVEISKRLGDIEIAEKNNIPLTVEQLRLKSEKNNLKREIDDPNEKSRIFMKMLFPDSSERLPYEFRYTMARDEDYKNMFKKERFNKKFFRGCRESISVQDFVQLRKRHFTKFLDFFNTGEREGI